MPRKISAGAILTDGTSFLVCHATGQKIWDIPKGGVEVAEDFLDACLREVKEETGFTIPTDIAVIQDLGQFTYLPAKDLYLFKITLDKLPNIDTLKCTEMVKLPNRKPFPEADAFKYVTKENAHEYVSTNLRRTLIQAGVLDE
jgi:8-oxo-dGTP pyrophosphatase MutT (NUDIX family)